VIPERIWSFQLPQQNSSFQNSSFQEWLCSWSMSNNLQEMHYDVFTCILVSIRVYIYGNYTYSYTYSLFVCMVWLYMYIYIYIKPKLCSKKQCTHSCLARAVKCWSSAVPAAHGLTQANPTNYLYLEYIHDWLVVYLPLWKIFVSWEEYSKYMET
jgi:hypothetical protein